MGVAFPLGYLLDKLMILIALFLFGFLVLFFVGLFDLVEMQSFFKGNILRNFDVFEHD